MRVPPPRCSASSAGRSSGASPWPITSFTARSSGTRCGSPTAARRRSSASPASRNILGVQPFTVTTTIDKPREEVFEYLADIANHAEFEDHYKVDWHLTREDSYGTGAGARYRITAPMRRFAWADFTLS